MRGPRSAVRLHPAPARTVHRAMPQTPPFRAQGGVGHFQHDAAHVLVGEEILAGELQIVQAPIVSKKKGSLRQPAKKR